MLQVQQCGYQAQRQAGPPGVAHATAGNLNRFTEQIFVGTALTGSRGAHEIQREHGLDVFPRQARGQNGQGGLRGFAGSTTSSGWSNIDCLTLFEKTER